MYKTHTCTRPTYINIRSLWDTKITQELVFHLQDLERHTVTYTARPLVEENPKNREQPLVHRDFFLSLKMSSKNAIKRCFVRFIVNDQQWVDYNWKAMDE